MGIHNEIVEPGMKKVLEGLPEEDVKIKKPLPHDERFERKQRIKDASKTRRYTPPLPSYPELPREPLSKIVKDALKNQLP